MGPRSALLEALALEPADELGWLALADCLEEEGEASRAELVRLSVQLRQGQTGDEERLRQLVASGLTVPLPRRRVPLGEVFLDMVLIPPGTFWMGSPAGEDRSDADEGPQHRVELAQGFWLGVYQVTQAQWQAVMERVDRGRFRGLDRPIEGISWLDGQRFLEALGHGARFPTEAEWEYACRGLTTTPFYFGDSLSSSQANFDGYYPYGTAPVDGWLEMTTPVGQYSPNVWGLYDMHGNVWEWCHDWYDADYYQSSPERDPSGPEQGTMKVLRGGSWYSYSWSCRSAGRERAHPVSGSGNYGLRVAASVQG